ncbi:minor extracellular serine protease Vpr [Salirhabdus euzebyi]|uniref:Minor extracellular serine protease Vpr n=1 Tax=Salirhabdus euzebyi TaxID=394506 RepID=A0A841Q851_9BACI|nr:S8 family serine peptidase [Salirhabdus euzebyi]MBB6454578.1 minor extracellular serine protease Vpr [Salirhabdus euzebyi]
MKRNFSKILFSLLAFVLIFSIFGFTVAANGGKKSKTQFSEIPLAEILGDIELSSDRPTSVIVELEEESIVEAKHKGTSQTKANLKSERGKVIKALEKAVKNADVNREYDYVFSGFSVELPGNEIVKLAAIPGVKAVYPNVHYTAEVISAEVISEEAFSPEMMNSAPFIGSNEAWEAGFTGEGVTVAVIDTGVDYTHPDLAHAFDDYKGYDFVDDDNDPQEGAGQYHGTHVSGTVAANGAIKGVAPDATLLGYRVLGPDGGTTEDVVAGIELAVQDGADVMNLSLGNSLNNPDWATSIALDWAMAEGVVAVTSNGNSGPDNWTVGSPGTSRDAISVGATQLPYEVYSVETTTTGDVSYESDKVMGYADVKDLTALDGNEYEFVNAGLGNPDDFKDIDVEGKIALISRGAIPFVDKAANAKAAGAVGAIIFNSEPEEFDFVIPGMEVPTIKMSGVDGQKILSELEKGNNTVSFDLEYVTTNPEVMADFSSRGPVTLTWMIKPDVSAPGVNIVSTFPGNGYAALQGTSMSAPHVAGASALLLEKNPNWGTEDVKAALMNTAVDVIDPATGKAYAHNSQGAGSIRIVDALNTTTLVAPGSHSFGKFVKNTGKQVEKQSFEIKNLSSERKSYSFDVEFAGNPDGIKVSTSNNLKVNPGKSQQVNFNVQVDTSKLEPGYYEATISVSDGTQKIDVPSILFVGEPDYPRLTGAFLEKVEEGSYYVGSYLPGGAEVVQYNLFELNGEKIGEPIDTLGTFSNAPAPYHEFLWDGKVGGEELEDGEYVLGVYVEQAGVTEYKAYLVTKN